MPNDILSGPTPVVLGENWYGAEQFEGDVFRWVANDAMVYIAAFHPYDYRVTLEVESGPGIGGSPFELEILGRDGRNVATLAISSRQTASFILPATEPTMYALRLHLSGGGLASPGDDRVLNFRVFRLAVRMLRPDVVARNSDARVGAGWYPLEHFGNETFRWVNDEAFVEIGNPDMREISFEVEPGPGVEFKPFVLRALEAESRNVIAEQLITSRERISIPLDSIDTRPALIQLVVEGGGRVSPGDARILNFRAFSVEPETRKS